MIIDKNGLRWHAPSELERRYLNEGLIPRIAKRLALRDSVRERIDLGLLALHPRWHYFPVATIQSAGQWVLNEQLCFVTAIDIRSDFPLAVTLRLNGDDDIVTNCLWQELTGPNTTCYELSGDGLFLSSRDSLLVRFQNTSSEENVVKVAVCRQLIRELFF